MEMNRKLILSAKILGITAGLYIVSFLLLSWRGKSGSYSYDGKIWSFGTTRQSSHLYFPTSKDFIPELLERERNLCLFYRPLIQLDALLTKDKHIYHEIAPECGK